MPQNLQKIWKKHLATYRFIQKTIYTIKHNPNWHMHLIIQSIPNHFHTSIPSLSTHLPLDEWITELGNIGKIAQKQALTTKHSRTCAKKAITRFPRLINQKSKKGNKTIFNTTDNSTLDSLLDCNNNIFTHPSDISNEIFIQQSLTNAPTVTNCQYQTSQPPTCTCNIRQYPWHDISGFTLKQRGDPHIPISSYFDRNTYDICLKQLSKNKTPDPDKIPNSILQSLPHQFHTMLFLFFLHCYKHNTMPTSWKMNHTILLYKKGNPTLLSNHRPIALANTIYKLFTSTLTTLLSSYGEKYQILHNSQEGCRQERCTSRQIQLVIAALKDAKFSKQNIYLLYIDFTNAFGSIDHARLLAIMSYLEYLEDAITIINNIYSKSYTKFIGSHFDPTQPIPI